MAILWPQKGHSDTFKGTPDLCVKHSKDFTLHGYSDASHSDDPNNTRSVSGYLCMFLQEDQ